MRGITCFALVCVLAWANACTKASESSDAKRMPKPPPQSDGAQETRVVVEIDTPDQKVVVPQAALIADQQGPYVFIVEDGKAAIRRIKLGDETGTDVVVEDGLQGGEQVIVEGLQAMRSGAPVRATPVTRTVGGN